MLSSVLYFAKLSPKIQKNMSNNGNQVKKEPNGLFKAIGTQKLVAVIALIVLFMFFYADFSCFTALTHNQDTVTHSQHFRQFRGYHDNGLPLLYKIIHQCINLAFCPYIDSPCGFVKYQDVAACREVTNRKWSLQNGLPGTAHLLFHGWCLGL